MLTGLKLYRFSECSKIPLKPLYLMYRVVTGPYTAYTLNPGDFSPEPP